MSTSARRLLWLTSTLAVIWTIVNVVMLLAMPGGCPMCVAMGRGQAGNGGMSMPNETVMGGPWMGWMMLTTALTWIVMVILDAAFLYLIASALSSRSGRSHTAASTEASDRGSHGGMDM